jgi:hypothetical protein
MAGICSVCDLCRRSRPDMPRVLTDEEDDILTNQFIQRLYATIDALTAERDRAVAELEVVALSRNVYSTSLNMMEREQNAMLPVVRAAMEWYCDWAHAPKTYPDKGLHEVVDEFRDTHSDLARRIEEVTNETQT